MSIQTSAPAASPDAPGGPAITLANDGSQWAGTFGVVVRALIEDILSDGEGFTATITTLGGFTRTGLVQSLDEGGYVVMGDPDSEDPYDVIPVEDIVRINVH